MFTAGHGKPLSISYSEEVRSMPGFFLVESWLKEMRHIQYLESMYLQR